MSDIIKGFPSHKKTDAQKGKKYYKDCVEAGFELVNYDDSMGLRASREDKIINYNLWNDIIDESEVQRVVNPFNIEYGKLPNNYKNCPLVNPNLTLLFGEERKRFYNPVVTVINSDAISEKINDVDQEVDQFMVGQVINPSMSQEQIQAELEKLNQWKNYTYQDKRERMASQILKYLKYSLNLKFEYSRAFEDLAIGGEEIYAADIVSGEPVGFRVSPVNTITLKSGISPKIEDSEVIIFDEFVPPGKLIDMYYDELTPSEIDKIERGSTENRGLTKSFMGNQLQYTNNDLDEYVDAVGIGEVILRASKKGIWNLGGSFDKEGNVRWTRVLWKGMRKIGILTYFDEDGVPQKTIVPEQYEPNELMGEQVKWIWISEWNEGTKIADDIFVKMGPRKVQFRHLDNLSISSPGVVGTIMNVGDQSARSLMSMARSYQYIYNAIFHQLELDIAKDKGVIVRIDASMIPDGWTMDKWLYYMEAIGYKIEDPMNEGKKGAALGKLAGAMQQTAPVIDATQTKSIQQKIQLLEFLAKRVDEMMGITDQRKGAVDNRETRGGIERSVTQSTLITEKLFSLHDDVRVRFDEVLLETAKVAWRDQKFKRSFFMDDMTQAVLDFDSKVYNEAEYGVKLSNSSTDLEMMQNLKSLSQAFLQNGGSLAIVADLFRTSDPSSFQRKLEKYEEQRIAREQEAAQLQKEISDRALEFEKYKHDTSLANERYLKELEIAANNQNQEAMEKLRLERDKLQQQSEEFNKSFNLDKQKQEEAERHNRAAEQISKQKKTTAS